MMLLYKNRTLWRFFVLFFLMPTIYSIFGWSITNDTEVWSQWLTESNQLQKLNIIVLDETARQILYGLSLLIILGITFGITIWSRVVTSLLAACFKSNMTAITAVVFWSLGLALIIIFINYFAEFMLLLGSAILGRLELQESGYNNWQTCSILTAICVCSFAIGLLGFEWFQFTMTTV